MIYIFNFCSIPVCETEMKSWLAFAIKRLNTKQFSSELGVVLMEKKES